MCKVSEIKYYCQHCVQEIYAKHRTAEDRLVYNKELDNAAMPFGQKYCTNCGQEMEWPEKELAPFGRSDGTYEMTSGVYPFKVRKM